MSAERVEVAIIGAGPAGLAAAAELCRRAVGSVRVLEREAAAGGIPRHADHLGFGLRDLHRSLSGPAYARELTERALRAGAELALATQVTGITPDGRLELTGPAGRTTVRAGATILATGCRERPRSARLIAGTRPSHGVMTTGQLQQRVHLNGERLDGRAVVVGAEHVSYSALATLAHAGARATAIVTEHPRHQSFAAFAAGARARYRAPLLTRTAVTEIHGRDRLEAVTCADLGSGATRRLECELLILTADWIPDHELGVLAGARLDPGTRGPAIDASGHTTVPGLFAAGNVLHGAETADLAAIKGRHLSDAVVSHLGGRPWPAPLPPIVCEPPLRWLVPEAGRSRLRAREHLTDVRIELAQDARVIARNWLPRVMAGRSATIDSGWLERADPAGGPVRVRVSSARRRDPARPSAHSRRTETGN